MIDLDKWSTLKNTDERHACVDNEQESFLFKSGSFFDFSKLENFKQLGLFFSDVMPDTPTDQSSVDCPLGHIQRRSLLVDPNLFYAPCEVKIRQGDLIEMKEKITSFVGPLN
jgi:hypothetical protein